MNENIEVFVGPLPPSCHSVNRMLCRRCKDRPNSHVGHRARLLAESSRSWNFDMQSPALHLDEPHRTLWNGERIALRVIVAIDVVRFVGAELVTIGMGADIDPYVDHLLIRDSYKTRIVSLNGSAGSMQRAEGYEVQGFHLSCVSLEPGVVHFVRIRKCRAVVATALSAWLPRPLLRPSGIACSGARASTNATGWTVRHRPRRADVSTDRCRLTLWVGHDASASG